MNQKTLFDAKLAEQEKDAGMATAAANRAEILEMAKLHARKLAIKNGSVDADMVYQELIADGYKIEKLGPAAGSIFKANDWEFVCWTDSHRVSNHRRAIRVWRLKS